MRVFTGRRLNHEESPVLADSLARAAGRVVLFDAGG